MSSISYNCLIIGFASLKYNQSPCGFDTWTSILTLLLVTNWYTSQRVNKLLEPLQGTLVFILGCYKSQFESNHFLFFKFLSFNFFV